MNCLIGYTGFVGSNIASKRQFDVLVNSKNSKDIIGQSFDEIVCAGVPAVKWKANAHPDEDIACINSLIDVLKTTTAKKFTLISTIDVYAPKTGVDEKYDCHRDENDPYGKHRLMFEDFCKSHFNDVLVVRLPGLFGYGLKKNVIFDLMNDNCLDAINPKSSFQYYFLDHLADDIDLFRDKISTGVVNVFTEPIVTEEIASKFFAGKDIGQNAGKEVHYDAHTIFASINGKTGCYMYSKDEVMRDLEEYLSKSVKCNE